MTDTMLVGAYDLEEHNLCRIGAYGWRYASADVVYERHTTIIGGPLLALTTGLLSTADNARRRRAAQLEAAPQWRPLGWLDIIATSRRLLVLHQAVWWSVWYSAVTHASQDGGSTLVLRFLHDAPYCLVGNDVPLLVQSFTLLSARPSSTRVSRETIVCRTEGLATTGTASTSVTSRSVNARPSSSTAITPSNHPPAPTRVVGPT